MGFHAGLGIRAASQICHVDNADILISGRVLYHGIHQKR